jgi:hypothetical protein
VCLTYNTKFLQNPLCTSANKVLTESSFDAFFSEIRMRNYTQEHVSASFGGQVSTIGQERHSDIYFKSKGKLSVLLTVNNCASDRRLPETEENGCRHRTNMHIYTTVV